MAWLKWPDVTALGPGAPARTYGAAFFDKQAQASHRSAGVIVPAVLRLIDCASVVDVGCGVGPWLRAVSDCGINDYLGINGDWVPTDRLGISAHRFRAHLRRPLDLGRRFDLAICVEVAEHLPADAAATLVDTLTSLAPVVLFSAAVPDQGGDGHINEQWPGYWAALFRERGFAARYDCIRLPLWNDSGADWWYRQNVLLLRGPQPDAERTRRADGRATGPRASRDDPGNSDPPTGGHRPVGPAEPSLDEEPSMRPVRRPALTGWRSALDGVRRGRSGR